MIAFQHLNYVFHYVCHIFSMQHLYIVLYCMEKFAFTLIFNTLDIEVHYDCYVFTVQRVYSGQNFLTYHTVSYRIHPWTLGKDRSGFMHTRPISVHEYYSVQSCKLLQWKCWWWGAVWSYLPRIVRYCALLYVIVHYFENQPKKHADLFARKKKML